jgi:tol-pal system protein YbgF
MMAMCARAFLALLAAMLIACGGGARDAELRDIRERVAAVQGRLARYDTQIADIQNQLFLIADQLNRERSEAEAARPPPRLQVVKLAPPVAKQGPAGRQPAAPGKGAAPAAARGAAVEPAPEVFELELEGEQEPDRLPVTRVPPPPSIPRHDAAEADALFRDALTAFREGRAEDASSLFGRFVDRYPEHAHADKALFWMGESRFEARAYAEAIADFRRLLVRYPRSSKVADALFRMGVAYERLGSTTEARQAFQDLVSNYPSTALADVARARLGGEAGGAR